MRTWAWLLLLAAVPQDGEVDRIQLRFQQRREKVQGRDATLRLLADTREELERFARENPKHRDVPRAAFHAVETYLWAQDTKTGLEKLRRFLKDHPDSEQAPTARFVVGEVLLQTEDDAGARAAFEEFARAHPKDERVLYARIFAAITLQNERKYDEAVAALLETRRTFKDRKECWTAVLQASLVHHLQGANDDARRLLEEVVRECPERGQVETARRQLSEYLKVGTDAPTFAEKDPQGTDLVLEKGGGKVVVLYFFDTPAPYAPGEAAFLRRAAETFKGRDFRILGVSVNLDRRDLELFRMEHRLDWPVFFDGRGLDGKIARLYGVRALPALTVVDRKGRIRFFNVAERDLLHCVEKLLQEN